MAGLPLDAMKQRWQQGQERFFALEKREKTLCFAAVCLVILLGGWQFLVEPLRSERRQVESERQALAAEVATLKQRRGDLATSLSVAPGEDLRQRQQQLQQRLTRLDREIETMTTGLISPQGMVALLRDMLSHHRGVRLESVEHEAPQGVSMNARTPVSEASLQENGSQLYAHGVRVRISGEYMAILDYLEAMESLDNRLGWQSLDYQVEEWPEAQVQIRLQTLSLSREWLGV